MSTEDKNFPQSSYRRMKVRPVFFLVLSILLSGCTAYNFSAIKRDLGTTSYDGHYIRSVPFERQIRHQCGPAALSSVMKYWGKRVSPEEISKAVYIPHLRGTLDFDLENYPKNYGLWVQGYSGTLEDLKAKIKKDIPLIVLQRQGPQILNKYHYSVVVGYDQPRGLVIAHTGYKQDAVFTIKEFLKRWDGTQNWTLLVVPPGKIDWQLSAEGHNCLGLIYERQSDLLRAEDNYDSAIQLKPNVATFYFNLGNVKLKMRKFKDAESAYKRVIKLDPAFADAYNNLACVYLEERMNLGEAKRLVDKAFELNPEGKAYYLDTLAGINEVLEVISSCEKSTKTSQNLQK